MNFLKRQNKRPIEIRRKAIARPITKPPSMRSVNISEVASENLASEKDVSLILLAPYLSKAIEKFSSPYPKTNFSFKTAVSISLESLNEGAISAGRFRFNRLKSNFI